MKKRRLCHRRRSSRSRACRAGAAYAPGSRVLINGASGSVGPFAVQVAKALGAHVTGVCSPNKADMVRGLGADEVIDYTAEDYTKGGQRYDWILDVAGNQIDLRLPARIEPQRRLRPPRRHDAPDLRLPVLGPADLAGNTEEDGIPVVETLPPKTTSHSSSASSRKGRSSL